MLEEVYRVVVFLVDLDLESGPSAEIGLGRSQVFADPVVIGVGVEGGFYQYPTAVSSRGGHCRRCYFCFNFCYSCGGFEFLGLQTRLG